MAKHKSGDRARKRIQRNNALRFPYPYKEGDIVYFLGKEYTFIKPEGYNVFITDGVSNIYTSVSSITRIEE